MLEKNNPANCARAKFPRHIKSIEISQDYSSPF